MKNNRILLIRTGGTIDAKPYDDPRNPPEIVDALSTEDSLISGVLKEIGAENVDQFTWLGDLGSKFVKDSKEFTQRDLEALGRIINGDDHSHFIITHGTDAMVENAKYLKLILAQDKTIVFVGAMVPLSMQDRYPSDGIESLRYAIGNISEKGAGVYVIGRESKTKRLGFFDPEKVEKDRESSLQELSLTFQPR